MNRPNLKIIGIGEAKETHLKGPENIFNKVIEEKISNLKKEKPIKVQEKRAKYQIKPELLELHLTSQWRL